MRKCGHRVIVSLLLLFLVGCTQSEAIDLDALMADFFEAAEDAEIAASIQQLLDAQPDVATVAEMLRKGRRYPTAESGWVVEELLGLDDRTRPFHVYIPTGYDAEVQHPVLFDLHGGVSTAPFPAEEMFNRRTLWQEEADQRGWILIVPHGDRFATWFTAIGSANLHAQLDFVKRRYNVDENRVFISGFSDGASGALWQGYHEPTPWAGFLAFHGHPVVGGFGPYQTYPRNLLNRSIRATTGEYDVLYPPSDVQPFYSLFTQIGVNLEWVVYPVGHETSFLVDELPFSIEFLTSTVRAPLRREVIWETADLEIGRCDWLRIDAIDAIGNDVPFPDANVVDDSRGIVFGVALDYRLNDGFRVAGIEPGTLARTIGVKNDDRILTVDGSPVISMEDIAFLMQGKRPGDWVEVTVERGGDEIALAGEIPPVDFIFSRDLITGSIRAIADGNEITISVSQVSRFTLFLSSEQFDLSQPIRVLVNGTLVHDETVQPELEFMLAQAAQDNDRTQVYEAKIEIQVPAI